MSTVVEKLVEYWLDSQSERRYQPALIQLLVSEGWTILHNTRHSPLEFGKDVICRDPSGKLFALQLKGNPGARLTKTQAQEMLPQMTELLDVPVPQTMQKRHDEKHVAVIVTNGEVDEEARTEFEQLARRTASPLSPTSRLDIWTRGELLNRFRSKLSSIWPTSLEGVREILAIIAADGQSIPDPIKIAAVLDQSVGRPTTKMGSAERTARLTSLFVISEIIKGPWYKSVNHCALFQITVLSSVYGLRFADIKKRIDLVESYSNVALEHCSDLLFEANERHFTGNMIWAEHDMLGEYDVMPERVRLVSECASALLLSSNGQQFSHKGFAEGIIKSSFETRTIWGQGAVPSALLRYWAFRRGDASMKPDIALISILRGLLYVSKTFNNGLGFPAPYYSFSQCAYTLTGGQVGEESDIDEDNVSGRLWFGRVVMFMLAKRNWKRTCKELWAKFSRFLHEEMELIDADFFDAQLTKRGTSKSIQLYSTTWRSLVDEAVSEAGQEFLQGKERFAWLIGSYVAIVPYRAVTPVVLWLDRNLSKTWYSADHLPS